MKTRSQVLELIKDKEFDLLIIGGGVVGAGVAQDAASRGLSVLLIEKDDFASGTSSRTTKLIHGGLRYLEQLQFRLTRELCQERGLLEQLAPHMVRDFSFVLPITKGQQFFGFKADLGLTIYDLLSINARGVRTHERLSRRDTLRTAPSLDPDAISGGLRFHDCITDDSRVVLAVLKSACDHGALAINYLEAVEFERSGDKIEAVTCQDNVSGQRIKLRAKALVNAAGVWSDKLLAQIEPTWNCKVKPAKGTHIMLPLSSFDTSSALFLPTPDGRYVFVVPWQKALMVGTTDENYDGPLDNPVATTEEIDYLLGILNSYSCSRSARGKLERSDVIAAWAGLRPLVDSGAAATATISREHLLFEGPCGIIGLIGGKLTNFRMLAIHVTDMALVQLRKMDAAKYGAIQGSKTDKLMLGGYNSKEDYLASTAQVSARGRKLNLDPATIGHLIATYGSEAIAVLELAENRNDLTERICPDFPPIMAEVQFCLENEMAMSLDDILSRRIRLGFVHQEQCLKAAPKAAALLQILGHWDAARSAAEVAAIVKNLQNQMAPAMPAVPVS
jgi:glycerol-3-phosphate dehydrogenase